jgi:hypothetical protein
MLHLIRDLLARYCNLGVTKAPEPRLPYSVSPLHSFALPRTTTAFATLITELDAKIDAQAVRITALEAVNVRLVECMSRFTAMLDERALVFTEQLVSVDERVSDEAAEKFNAFLSNASDILQLENRVDHVELTLSRRGSVIFVPVSDEGMS